MEELVECCDSGRSWTKLRTFLLQRKDDNFWFGLNMCLHNPVGHLRGSLLRCYEKTSARIHVGYSAAGEKKGPK